MIWILMVAFIGSSLATLGVIASAHRNAHWADHDLDGPQKMHALAVPRVGGIGIFVGIVSGTLVLMWVQRGNMLDAAQLLLCMMPAFFVGLWEDFTKSVSPRRRFVVIALSALLGAWLLHATMAHTGWQALDKLFAATGLGALVAVFVVTGVANAINIIDGMNGLASMCVALMMAGMAYIAFQVGDILVAGLSLATLGAALGFFMWNYPRGLVFLGDGGAYLLGFVVAELGVVLCERNPEVSPLAPLALVAYPVFETVFTMYRRRVIRGRPMTLPDGIHLHTLIYRRLMRWAVGSHDPQSLTRGNSRTSPYLWVLSSVSVAPTAVFWNNTPALALSLLVFVVIYLRLYWQIVTFRTPAWMQRRRPRGPIDKRSADA